MLVVLASGVRRGTGTAPSSKILPHPWARAQNSNPGSTSTGNDSIAARPVGQWDFSWKDGVATPATETRGTSRAGAVGKRSPRADVFHGLPSVPAGA